MKKRMVFDYIKAAVNLYGVANKNLVVQIYNHQNEDDQIDVAAIDELMGSKSLKNSFFTFDGEWFIHNDISKLDLVEYVRNSQKDKPYYVPEQKTLLFYKDETYIDRTTVFNQFKSYLVQFFNLTEEQAETYCVKSYFKVKQRIRMQEIMADISKFGLQLSSNQLDDLMKNLAVFMNHVRRWENGGLMPVELANTGYHAMKNQMNVKQVTTLNVISKQEPSFVEVGRNDLCYCGSGKKFKKCHGIS